MSLSWKLSFGGYDFPTGFHPVSLDGGQDIQAAELPRRPGAATQDGREKPRTITVMGGWTADTLTAWESTRNTILAAVSGTGDLYFGNDGYYYKDAQLLNWSQSTPADGRLWAKMGLLQLTFTASRFPELFDSVNNTPTLTTVGGTIVYGTGYSSYLGTADTYPTWTITIDSGGTGPIQLSNSANGDNCVIAKPVGNFSGGDVIVICGLPEHRVYKINGTKVNGLVSGRIPKLKPFVGNGIVLNTIGSATALSLTTSFPGRYK